MRVLAHDIEELARLGAPNLVVLDAAPSSIEDLVKFVKANHASYWDGREEMYLVQLPGADGCEARNKATLAAALA